MHLYLSSLSILPLLLSSPPSLLSSSSIHTLTLPTPPSSLPPAGFYCPPVLLPPITRSSSSSPLGNQAELTDISSCRHKWLNYNPAPSQLTPFELVLTIVFLMALPEPRSEPNVSLSLDWWLTEIMRPEHRLLPYKKPSLPFPSIRLFLRANLSLYLKKILSCCNVWSPDATLAQMALWTLFADTRRQTHDLCFFQSTLKLK